VPVPDCHEPEGADRPAVAGDGVVGEMPARERVEDLVLDPSSDAAD
jgi:hypothetical protein